MDSWRCRVLLLLYRPQKNLVLCEHYCYASARYASGKGCSSSRCGTTSVLEYVNSVQVDMRLTVHEAVSPPAIIIAPSSNTVIQI